MKTISRAQAKSLGLKRYFTGRPCKRGHIAERETINSSCLCCVLVRRKKHYLTNRETIRIAARAAYKADPGKYRAASVAYRRDYPERVRASQRKTHGLPVPTRPEPILCEICGQTSNGRGKLHLDHDHVTGKFRGWLCHNCNTGLGKLGDSMRGLETALIYLRRNT